MTSSRARLLPCLLLALAPLHAQQANPNASDEEAESRAVESDSHRRFWQASLNNGHYMVALDRIASVSMHEYVLDGSLLVREMVLDTTGRAIARFYHIEPVTDSMKQNGILRLADRGRELLDRAGQRAGTEVHNMAQKNYPATTHAGMVEYRVLDLRDLDAIYDSARKAWISGKGRTVTLE